MQSPANMIIRNFL